VSHSCFAQDDRTLGAAMLHQVLSKTWGYPEETICKIQQAFDDDARGVTQIEEWFNCFKDGRMSVDSDQHSRRSSTSRYAVMDKVWISIVEDHRLNIREIADEVGISRGSANMILTDDFN
jgi:hypothetical protein